MVSGIEYTDLSIWMASGIEYPDSNDGSELQMVSNLDTGEKYLYHLHNYQ